jgi:hypothetical protein
MKSIALTILAVVVACGRPAAQDLEPNRERAAQNVAAALGRDLLGRVPAPDSLRVLPRTGASEANAAVRSAISEAGFRLVDAPGAGTLELQAWSEGSAPRERLVIETVEPEPRRFACAFGNADWIAQTGPALVVEGPWSKSPAEALHAARERAFEHLLRRASTKPVAQAQKAALGFHRDPGRTFVAESAADEGVRLYRAWCEVPDPGSVVKRLRRELARAERKLALEPWVRGGGTAVLAAVLGLLYLRTDWRTRGYLTGRLRLLFAILFVAGAGFCWRVPL